MKLEKIIKAIKNRFFNFIKILTTKTEWINIKSGPLKDGFIFLNKNLYEGWGNMENGLYDEFIYNYLNKENLSDKIIWDVGAHFGYHTLCFANLVNANGQVLAFEPNPYNLDRLKINIEKNKKISKRIIVIDKALSNNTSKINMSISSDVDGSKSSGGYLKNIPIKPLDIKNYKGFKDIIVDTIKIDDFIIFNKAKDPDIIKIDVEGAESLVLSGASELLKRKHPLLFIEIHDIVNMFYVQKFLFEMNYKIKLLDEQNASSSRCFIVAY